MAYEENWDDPSSDWVAINDENTLCRWMVAPMSSIDFDGVSNHIMLSLENAEGTLSHFFMSPFSAANMAHDLLAVYLEKDGTEIY